MCTLYSIGSSTCNKSIYQPQNGSLLRGQTILQFYRCGYAVLYVVLVVQMKYKYKCEKAFLLKNVWTVLYAGRLEKSSEKFFCKVILVWNVFYILFFESR
eukprot:TRINITY_DN4955_c0_g1_i2.p6 TRINITY_DN4955_c0_g1~~TRINITY_DN4955_c0_g1_i2.p6  ORF type:complete len:100 (-),score=2.39 TRINITY_DN4955_c0_g1_i2:135-434(-)